jgi:hypothetical protein
LIIWHAVDAVVPADESHVSMRSLAELFGPAWWCNCEEFPGRVVFARGGGHTPRLNPFVRSVQLVPTDWRVSG